mgnify:CR=1 FL=1
MIQLKDLCQKASSNIAQKDLEGHEGQYPIYGASGLIGYVDFYKQENPYVAVVKDGAGIGRVMCLPEKSSVIGTMQYILPNEGVNVHYLAFAMEHMNLAKYFSGATIPHIYFKDYGKEKLLERTEKEQKSIAEILSKMDSLISLRKQQLAKLDELVKARFVEMFGNPIENTMNWPKKLLRDITTKIGSGATPKGGRESYPNAGVSLIRSMNVYDGQFLYKDLAHLTDEQATQLNGVTVEAEDVLVNITGASVARSCVVPKDVLPARVNQHVAIVRCNRELLNPIFTNKMFINNEFKKALLSIGESGGATRQAITKKQLEELSVVVPPLSIQNEFFTFSERVDQQKQTVQQSLDKLELMKKALMQEYFG